MFLRYIHLQTILVIVAPFVLGTVDSQTIEIHPPTIGAQTNEQNVVLSCNVYGLPVNTYIAWIYYPPWTSNGFLIYSTFDGISRDPSNFTVYHSTLGTDTQSLDLVINTAKRELATRYMCSLSPIPGFGMTIHVVVIDPVECPGSIVEYDVGNTTNIACSVNYYDSTLTYAPNIVWYRDGQLVPGQFTIDEANNRKAAILIRSVTLADDGEKFVCFVDFSDRYEIIMDYTDNCSTSFHVRTTDAIPRVPSSETGPMVSIYTPSISLDIGQLDVFLRCSVSDMPDNTYIDWIYYPRWHQTEFIIYSTYNNSNNDPTNFTVKPTTLYGDTLAIDLIINTLKAEFVTQYLCRLGPNTGNGDALNVLQYLSGTVKNVSFYPPSSADAPITLEVGDVIECMADGKREPTIEWYDPYGKYLSWERELVVTVDMRTWDQPIVLDCRATNTIDNGVTSAFARGDYTFYVAEEVGQSSGTEAWVIAVSVIVPIVVMAAIAIAVFFIIRRREMRKEKSTTKTKITTASTAALQFHY